jgi:hypothetical protein
MKLLSEEHLLKTTVVMAAFLHMAGVLVAGKYTSHVMPVERVREKAVILLSDVQKAFKPVVSEPEVVMKPMTNLSEESSKTLSKNILMTEKPLASKSTTTKSLPKNFGLLAIRENISASSSSLSLAAPIEKQVILSKKTGLSDTSHIDAENEISLAPISVSGTAYQGEIENEMKAEEKKRVQVSKKEIEVRAGIPATVIQQLVAERLPSMRICYEMAMLQKPDLKGELTLSWTIQPNGSVSDVLSESKTIDENLLHPCLRERIVLWKFPHPKGGGIVNVKYPFVFSRTQTKPGTLEVSVTEGGHL